MRSLSDIRGTDVTYTRQDPALAGAPLFRSFKPGHRPSGLIVEYSHDGTDFLFTGGDWLDVRDQSIFLAMIGLAGIYSSPLGSENTSPVGRQLWSELAPFGDSRGGSAAEITTTRYKLLKAADLPTRDDDYERLKESLHRLAQIVCRERRDGFEWVTHLLSYVSTPSGEIRIALNSRIAHALSNGHYVKLCLQERRKLDNDPAKLLHAWLSTFIREGGKSYWTGLDAASQKIWGPISKISATQRSRRAQVRKALGEIAEIGWKLETRGELSRLQFQFQRPKARSD